MKDRELVAACIEGDEAAWTQFTSRVTPVIQNTIRAHGIVRPIDGLEPQDIVSLVFEKLLQNDCALLRDQPNRGKSLNGYIAGVTRNVVRRLREKTARKMGVGDHTAADLDPAYAEYRVGGPYDRCDQIVDDLDDYEYVQGVAELVHAQ